MWNNGTRLPGPRQAAAPTATTPVRRQLFGQVDHLGGQRDDALVQRGERRVAARAAQAFHRQLERMQLAQAAPRVGRAAATFQLRHPGLPHVTANTVDECVQGVGEVYDNRSVHVSDNGEGAVPPPTNISVI